jgi:hypothetical protein
LVILLGGGVSILIKLGGIATLRLLSLLFGSSDNTGTGLFEVQVICEEVALLGVNNRLDNLTSVISELR